MKYITTIYTETGHDYNGPDTDVKALIKAAKEDIANNPYDSPMTKVYVSKCKGGDDIDSNMPDSDSDPVWMWSK